MAVLFHARIARHLRSAGKAAGLVHSLHSQANVSPVKSVQSSPYAQTLTTSNIINFGIGQPSASLLPLDMIRNAAIDRFKPTQDPLLLQYGAAKGFIGFREEIANLVAVSPTFSGSLCLTATRRDILNYNYKAGSWLSLQSSTSTVAISTDSMTTGKRDMTYSTKAAVGASNAGIVDPDSVMVTAGNSQAISHAAMVFTKTNKRVFVEEPTYFLAHDIFRELGLDLKGIRVGKDGIDLDMLEATLAAGDVPAFLYTIPFFHNPTGTVMSPERCEQLVGLAQKYGFRIISDEPYNLLHLDGDVLPPLASYDESGLVVSLGSFSKILAPGLRLGWAQSSKKTIEELSTVGVLRSGGGQNPVTASLVHTVLEQGLLLPHIDHLKNVFRGRKAAMCDALRQHCPDVVFTEPSGGYFVWLELPDGVHTERLLQESIAHHGVAFTPGTRCSLGSLYGDGDGGVHVTAAMTRCARLSFAFYDEDEIRMGIQRLQSAIVHLK